MLKSFTILNLLLQFLVIQTSRAQWEQIGWPGGYMYVIGQVGNTLYAKSGNGYYISKDWGKNWTMAREGLPLQRSLYKDHKIIEKNGRAVLCNAETYPMRSTQRYSFYYATQQDPQWRLKEFTPIDSHWYLHDMSSLHLFSDDSIAVLNIFDGYYELPYHSTNGVYISTNGGNTWQKRTFGITLPITNVSFYRRLERQGNSLILYCTEPDTSNGKHRNHFYRSDNFGESWSNVSMPLPDSVDGAGYLDAISDSLMIFQTTGPGGYYFSNDKGTSWFAAPAPLPKREFNTIYPLKQRGKDVIISVVTGNRPKYELYKSSDNGRSWQRFYVGDSTFELRLLYGNDTTYLLAKPGNVDLWISDPMFESISILTIDTGSLSDGGSAVLHCHDHKFYTLDIRTDTIGQHYSSWSDDGKFLANHRLKEKHRLAYTPWTQVGNLWYAHGFSTTDTLSRLYRSRDDGLTWETIFTFPRAYSSISSIWEVDTLIASGLFMVVNSYQDSTYYSQDSGNTWMSLPLPKDVGSLKLSYANNILYLLENGRKMYTSYNFGVDWNEIALFDKIGYVRNGIYTADKRIFVSTDDETYYSDDAGITWSKAITEASQPFTIYTFEENVLYGLSDNGQNCQVHYSLDTGRTWKKMGDSCVVAEASLYMNEDFYFLASPAEIWRLPKLTLSATNHNHYYTDPPSLVVIPNPAVSMASIIYSIPKKGMVDLSIYDLLGRKHSTIASGMQDAGAHTAEWNAEHIPPGVYVLRLVTSEGSATRMLQVRR